MACNVPYYQRTQLLAASGNTTIASSTDQYDVDTVTLSILNGHATTAFDVAQLEFKVHPNSGWVAVEASGWATADNIVLSATNPVTLAGAAEMIIRFNLEGIYAWRLLASSNTSDAGPVTVWGIGKGEIAGKPAF